MVNFTIDDLLHSDSLTGLKIVAGGNKSDNVIANVNTIDNPDSYDWLKAGDFLLTTGYIYKETPEQLLSLIEQRH